MHVSKRDTEGEVEGQAIKESEKGKGTGVERRGGRKEGYNCDGAGRSEAFT